jgi:RNA polymerase sigma-70 factor (ECF subfamily)
MNPAAGIAADTFDEPALLIALRAGHDAAFAELINRFGGQMLAVARRLLGNEEDANDALQDALLSAFRAIGQFDGNSQLATWLHRITVNAALMRLRTRRRRPEVSIDDLLPRYLQDGHREAPGPAWPLTPAAALERHDLRVWVRQSIEQLPENYRTVLLLRDIEQLDTKAVAEILGVTEGVVKTRLHRARQALRTLLAPALERQL